MTYDLVDQFRCKVASSQAYCKAVIGVMAHCSKQAPKYVGAIKSRGHAMALKTIAALAVQHYCRTADTPDAACQCKGRGNVRDMDASRLHGKPVDKICQRCGGTGLRPILGMQIRRVIESRLGTLSRGEWERQWYPLYQTVLAWYHVQESEVEVLYKRVTAA